MPQHPATQGRPGRLRLATALTAAGAILGAALLWPGGPDPVSGLPPAHLGFRLVTETRPNGES